MKEMYPARRGGPRDRARVRARARGLRDVALR